MAGNDWREGNFSRFEIEVTLRVLHRSSTEDIIRLSILPQYSIVTIPRLLISQQECKNVSKGSKRATESFSTAYRKSVVIRSRYKLRAPRGHLFQFFFPFVGRNFLYPDTFQGMLSARQRIQRGCSILLFSISFFWFTFNDSFVNTFRNSRFTEEEILNEKLPRIPARRGNKRQHI